MRSHILITPLTDRLRNVRTPNATGKTASRSSRANFTLARELEDARGAIGELAGVGRMLPNPHLLIRPFIQREGVSSSRIEGTITRLDQLFLFEAEPDQVAHPADVEEVRNYVLACEYGWPPFGKGSRFRSA